jgi:hypothetical protein
MMSVLGLTAECDHNSSLALAEQARGEMESTLAGWLELVSGDATSIQVGVVNDLNRFSTKRESPPIHLCSSE